MEFYFNWATAVIVIVLAVLFTLVWETLRLAITFIKNILGFRPDSGIQSRSSTTN